jgi:plastocyanin
MPVTQGRRTIARIAALAAAAVGTAALGACGDDTSSTTGAADKAATPAAFEITATAEGKKKKSMAFPATIEAGLVEVTLKNSDTVPRSAQILRVDDAHTVDDVLKIVDAETDGVAIPAWMQDGGGLGTTAPGATAVATQVLAPGKHVIWDDEGGDSGPNNSAIGAKGEFTVTGPASDARLPAQPATVTATDTGTGKDKKYDFEFKGLKAGANTVRFENTGDELHHALFFPMRTGVTIKEVLEAFSSEEEPTGPPPVDFAKGVGTAVVDAGNAQNISLELGAGRYAVVCFISDRKGGKPHAAKGMLKELTLE